MSLLWLLLSSSEGADLATSLTEIQPHLERHSPFGVPAFSEEHLSRIQAGETVWRESKKPTGETLLTIGGLIEASPAAVWIAILDDDHNGLSDRITERELHPRQPGYKSLYQHLSLPYPLTDRHWIIEIQTDTQLYASSKQKIWRRGWDLDPRGEKALSQLAPDDMSHIQTGVWTPANEGEWLVLPLASKCLVIYRGRFDVGGRIPESIAQAVGSQGALDLFEQLQDLANEMPAHYRGSHPPILAPTGQQVPVW